MAVKRPSWALSWRSRRKLDDTRELVSTTARIATTLFFLTKSYPSRYAVWRSPARSCFRRHGGVPGRLADSTSISS
jgi:hypothetical protein